jgi:hypothetical protein
MHWQKENPVLMMTRASKHISSKCLKFQTISFNFEHFLALDPDCRTFRSDCQTISSLELLEILKNCLAIKMIDF